MYKNTISLKRREWQYLWGRACTPLREVSNKGVEMVAAANLFSPQCFSKFMEMELKDQIGDSCHPGLWQQLLTSPVPFSPAQVSSFLPISSCFEKVMDESGGNKGNKAAVTMVMVAITGLLGHTLVDINT